LSGSSYQLSKEVDGLNWAKADNEAANNKITETRAA
jgi:hypothetical protein